METLEPLDPLETMVVENAGDVGAVANVEDDGAVANVGAVENVGSV